MYSLSIKSDKWVNVGDLQLDENKIYWFKKMNGNIVMGTPHSNGASAGIADVYVGQDGRLVIRSNTFHIVKGGQVQEVESF